MERLDILVSLVPRPSFVFGHRALALSIISEGAELESRPAPVISYLNFRDEGAKHNSLERSERASEAGRRGIRKGYSRETALDDDDAGIVTHERESLVF